ncbi:MAG TPA: TAT-variant-translocated molybdopterin oxidoreductase [Blastocatellia bacterium]|nr:TAT-variant-translocated molybdopterin oxidoreductase [Blastocatellia bacterium]
MSELVQLKNSITKPGHERGEERATQSSAPEAYSGPQPSISDLRPPAVDLASFRTRLSGKRGKQYWRSLEELAETDEFNELLHREFPENATEWNDPVGRRKFLKLMGASLALAGITGCTRQPTETIAPYARQPEGIVLGKPLFFATAMPLGGGATGLLVESHEGRPTKVEPNPQHPASSRGTDVFSQASVLSLYDPDRSQTLTYLGEISTWSAFLGAVGSALAAQRAPEVQGAGIRILTESVISPTLAYQIRTMLADFPRAKWHQYDPAGSDYAREGGRMAFGQYANAIYHFDKARVILSLDSDFLSCGPASLRYAQDYASTRRLEEGKADMSRLYVVESTMTNTGGAADHRLPLRPSEIEGVARAIAAGVGVQGGSAAMAVEGERAGWVNAVVKDLAANRGASVVIAGDYQPPAVHALAHAMNQALGNAGNTVTFTDPLEANPVDGIASMRELVQDMSAGVVDTLLILGVNPVYTAPADLNFAATMADKVRLRIHLSLYKDETSELCHWNIPEAHYLESWSDTRAFDGTVTIIQPLIAPLYNGKTAHEVLAAFSAQPERKSYDIVRDYWVRRHAAGGQEPPVRATAAPAARATATAGAQGPGVASSQTAAGQAQPAANPPATGGQSRTGAAQATAAASPAQAAAFEQFWRRALHDGVVANTAAPTRTVAASTNLAGGATTPLPSAGAGLEISFRPDPTIYDGRFANNAWLQELPKPITSLVWDNAAIISPGTAARLGLGKQANGIATNNLGRIGGEVDADMVELQYQGRAQRFAVWIQPGQPDDCVTVHLGYGRQIAGRVGSGAGFDAYTLRTSDAPWFGAGLQVSKVGDVYPLVAVQLHHLIDQQEIGVRDLVRSGTLEEYRRNPNLVHEKENIPRAESPDELHHEASLYPEYDYSGGYAWGMAIDINSCVGCNACVVACQAENNIPVVGKEQVARRRAMHWLRVDNYYKGDLSNPQVYFQPVPCMHCEKAPCEVVCPVAATVHSADGLNDMVYNRCVGTRYCSNNCPYKVRRFNFLLYQDFETPTYKLMRNPEVTVRSRGVMEKCTYCIQRIQYAKIESEKEERPVRDGEIVTACQSACPSDAIVFGNQNDPNSRVAKLKAQERNYGLLSDLNTRPRTTYLAAIRNINPDIGPKSLMGNMNPNQGEQGDH